MSAASYAAFARPTGDGIHELLMSVKGVHCAACIQKIENAFRREAGVQSARLNFSTGRLVITWNGAAEMADQWLARITQLGYEAKPFDARQLAAEQDEHGKFLLQCLGIAAFAMGNMMLLSIILWSSDAITLGIPQRDFFHWISGLIAIPSLWFGARPFFQSAWAVLRQGRTNMDVPISLAFILATGVSLYELFHHGEHVYFDSAVMLMLFLLIGRYLDHRARANARSSARELLSMLTGSAQVLDGGQVRITPIQDLQPGMVVLVAMGERVPADGKVFLGMSEVDTSLLTGETLPRTVQVGDDVFSGTLNLAAPIQVQIMRPAEDSLVADIVRLMEKAEQANARYVRLADRMARLYTPIVHSLALASFLVWVFVFALAWQKAMMIATAVLIITCPCALALAVPVVQVLAVGRLMKRGILVKSGDALERMATITTVLLDKTGTLTLGQPALINQEDVSPDALQLAASLAVHSRHPLSRALAAAWQGDILPVVVTEVPGRGLECEWQGQQIRLGQRNWCGDLDTDSTHPQMEVWLNINQNPSAVFKFRDALREDAAEVVAALHQRGLKTVMLSGDRPTAVERVAKAVGIQDWQAALTPQGKYDALQLRQQRGEKILMVGDGLNDAPVLQGANVSMSPSTAIDLTQNVADVVFMGARLRAVLQVYDAAVLSRRLVFENFALSIVYNILAVPLAVMGYVTPMIAAIAMSSSSLLVILNSFRMRVRS